MTISENRVAVKLELMSVIRHTAAASIVVYRHGKPLSILLRKIPTERDGEYQFTLPTREVTEENGLVSAGCLAVEIAGPHITSSIIELGRVQILTFSNGNLLHGIHEVCGLSVELVSNTDIGKPNSPYALFTEEEVGQMDEGIIIDPAIRRAIAAHFNFLKTGDETQRPFTETRYDHTDPLKAALYKAYLEQM